MTQILSLVKNWLNFKLITGATLSLLLLASPAFSASRSHSDDPPPDTSGNSGGSRGCDTRTKTAADNIPALMLLTPTQGLGQTVATSPTFAWFVRDGSWPIKFKLYAYDPVTRQAKLIKEVQDENFKSSPGIMVLSLSNLVLSIGQTYIWQVELVCNPSHPSGNPFASAATRVVPMPPDLKTQLSHIHEQDRFNKADLYAKAGLWYDTLGIALTPGNDPKLKELKFSLLQQLAAASTDREGVGVRLTESSIYHVQR